MYLMRFGTGCKFRVWRVVSARMGNLVLETMAITLVTSFVKGNDVGKWWKYLLCLSALMPFDSYINVTLITKWIKKKR